MPELVPNFDGLDAAVRELSPPFALQPASSIVRTDGLSLHRAQAATDAAGGSGCASSKPTARCS